MKYKCDVVRDLMPLCMDEAATESSKDVVVEHIAECKKCEKYYSEISSEIPLEEDSVGDTKDYVVIAKRLRKRKLIQRAILTFVIFVTFELLFHYAMGFRVTPESASSLSGRLNRSSEVIGNYDWGFCQFYIYSSENSYDIVTVKRHWNGWRAEDNTLVWPKYITDEGGIINAGSIYYWTDTNDKFGIQLFPVIAEDPEVASIEVTVFNKTKKVDIKTNELTILTFENDNPGLGNQTSGYAYNASGNKIYELVQSKETMRNVWEKIVD